MDTRYFQYNSGIEGEKLVAPNIAYSTAANYAAFAASDTDGKFGIFKTDGTRVTTALSTGDTVFFALKRDGLVSKTTNITKGVDLTASKTLGTSGTLQVVTVVITCGGTLDCADADSCCTSPLTNYSIGLIDTQTTNSSDMMRDTWEYNLQGKFGKKIPDLLAAIRNIFNADTGPMNTTRGRIGVMSAVTEGGGASGAPYTYTFTITGNTGYFKPFSVFVKGFNTVSITYTTKAVEPAGTLKTITQVDNEGLIREGWRTKYVSWPFISSEWGEPTMFSKAGSTSFNQYMFWHDRFEKSNISGVERHYRNHKILLAVPTGSAIATVIDTVFAL